MKNKLFLLGIILIVLSLILCFKGIYSYNKSIRNIRINTQIVEKEIEEKQKGNLLIFDDDKKTKIAVYKGTSNENLKNGAGYLENFSNLNQEGNCIIFGHRDSAFRVFKKLKINDKITAVSGNITIDYYIESIEIYKYSEVPLLKTNTQQITLVTCYPLVFSGPALERMVIVAKPR